MSVLKEWECKAHGHFEGSHPLCPAAGCDSENVERAFLTPPNVSSGMAKRTDDGLRKSAESFGFANLRSAKEGESAKPTNRHNEMLWGNDAQNMIGKPLVNAAPQPEYRVKTDQGERVWKDRGGMYAAANEMGIQSVKLPAAQRTVSKFDAKK